MHSDPPSSVSLPSVCVPSPCLLHTRTASCLVLIIQAYIIFLAVWLLANYWSRGQVRPFTKVLTGLLSFKLLSGYSAYARTSLCDTTTTTFILLDVIHSASRALYESILYGVFAVLSSGLFIITHVLRSSRVSYLSFFISVLYMVLSAGNMLKMRRTAVILGIICFVWGNCAFFSWKSYASVTRLIHETGILRIDYFGQTLLSKRKLLIAFIVVSQCYFLCELAIHLLLVPFSHQLALDPPSRLALITAFHEAVELATSISVYYIYLQTIEIPSVPLSLSDLSASSSLFPLYLAGRSLEAGSLSDDINWSRPAIVINPGTTEMTIGFGESQDRPDDC